jgi:mRNA interferase ChpB
MPVFDRGEVVSLPLDPAIGHEQRGTRPALVLTTKDFNKLGDVMVAPARRQATGRVMRALP